MVGSSTYLDHVGCKFPKRMERLQRVRCDTPRFAGMLKPRGQFQRRGQRERGEQKGTLGWRRWRKKGGCGPRRAGEAKGEGEMARGCERGRDGGCGPGRQRDGKAVVEERRCDAGRAIGLLDGQQNERAREDERTRERRRQTVGAARSGGALARRSNVDLRSGDLFCVRARTQGVCSGPSARRGRSGKCRRAGAGADDGACVRCVRVRRPESERTGLRVAVVVCRGRRRRGGWKGRKNRWRLSLLC
ncbi:hypothetical protein BDY21DRAFT_153762 [Lineolata rhizophorae]|uniref:Uncharacterized protein n=1 Tax=Lineolata rhizophorae TaxID=578093 RepID=A0A6A6NM12_9PEZI|nr:hypothetical protein BDY21DRAFT_153762 [Lineolata rhizophorae]